MRIRGGGVGQVRRAVLPRGEFSFVWVAEALSVAGDQLAKVSLAVVVYQRTGSAAWSGVAYALTLLPALVTGPVLAPLADRLPRREVMLACCVVQAVVVVVMALPGVPLGVLAVAIAVVAGIAAPFKAAQAALVLDVLGAERNKAGRARLTVIREGGQLVGLAGAAAVVGGIGTTAALVVDAVSFLGAAVLIGFGVRARPAARSAVSERERAETASPLRLLLADRPVRLLSGLVLLVGFTAVPDGVIVPLAEQSGAPSWAVGPLLAADCLGLVLGARWVTGCAPDRQRALIAPLSVLSVAPLALFALRPSPVLMGALLIASGVGAAYLALAAGEVTERVPHHAAGSVNGLLGAGLRAGQGLAVVTGGVLAQYLKSAAVAVALTGVVGVLLVGWCALSWHRTLRPRQVKSR